MSPHVQTIILSKAQAKLVSGSECALAVRDEEGHDLGVLIPRTYSNGQEHVELKPEVAEELIRRMSQEDIRWSTTQEVLQRLGRRDAS